MTKDYSLFFIRHGKLLLPYKNHSVMPLPVLADLASSKLNPPIDSEFIAEYIPKLANKIPLIGIEAIYTSPSHRCQDTARLIGQFILKNYGRNIQPVTLPELKEIHFDLLKLHPHSDASRLNIESVNNTVFRAMVGGSEHCESAESAYQRINNLLKSNITAKSSLLLTHDFFMRVIEIYIKHSGASRHAITYDELRNTQRNLYLHGLATNFTFKNLVSF